MAIQPQNLQLGPPQPARPIAGFAQAMEFAVRYSINGVPCQGLATLHIAPAYDTAVMAVTAALSEARQWPGLFRVAAAGSRAGRGAQWRRLRHARPDAAEPAELHGLCAGGEGIPRLVAEELAGRHRPTRCLQLIATTPNSARHWAMCRPTTTRMMRACRWSCRTRTRYYWVNEQGTIVGTNDPSIDPNSGSTKDWRKMPKHQP